MTTTVRSGDGPPIVFISQLDTGRESWKPIIDRLPGAAAFAYDRPGCGNAPPRPAPNPPLPYGAFADELADLLDRCHITDPAVLVGHSIGSPIARMLAHRHPHRVAGTVFIDGALPQNMMWPETSFPVDGEGPAATTIDVITGQVELLRAEPLDVPAVVLTRRRRWWLPDYDAIPHPAIDDLWYVSQQLLARQWRAPLIIAERAGHQIPREAPDLVSYAIDAVVRAVRAGEPVVLEPQKLAEIGGATPDP
jgi:pimeloyl-ACP methyl ester carboxylesterase